MSTPREVGPFSWTLQSSSDGGDSFQTIETMDICRRCRKRTLVCPHRTKQEEIITVPPGTTDLKVVAVGTDEDLRCSITALNARSYKVLENTKFAVLEALTNLEDVWDQMGIKEEDKGGRINTITEHVTDLLNEMLAEETELKSKMELRVDEYKDEVQQLCQELSVPVITAQGSLVEMESKWRKEADALNKEKHDRQKCLRRLRNDEQMLCEELGLPQYEINTVGCPTKEVLRELEKQVVMLKGEKTRIVSSLQELCREICNIFAEMEQTPIDELGLLILQGKMDSMSLSSASLKNVKELKEKLLIEQEELQNSIDEKREEFKALWSRLENQLDDSSEIHFNEIPVKYTATTLHLLNENLKKVNSFKVKYLEKFISGVRSELAILWEKCHIGEEARESFMSLYSNLYTEDSLAAHEKHLQGVQQYYDDNKDLLRLVARREKLWEEKMELESKPEDNFNTRGGALLKQLKKKQFVEKNLPKTEKTLIIKVLSWEKVNGRSFIFNDKQYLDHIKIQNREIQQQKEKQKAEKLQAKMAETSKELQYGSSPKSTKRKMQNSTLRSAKSPMLKKTKVLNSSVANNTVASKFAHSSLSIPVSPHGRILKKKENPVPDAVVRKKITGGRLMTEARRKNKLRRSIQSKIKENLQPKNESEEVAQAFNETELSPSSILKGIKKSDNLVLNSTNLGNRDVLISYNDFSNSVGSRAFSRSSFIEKDTSNKEQGIITFLDA